MVCPNESRPGGSTPGIFCRFENSAHLADITADSESDVEVGLGADAAGFQPNWNPPRLQVHIRNRLAADLADSFLL